MFKINMKPVGFHFAWQVPVQNEEPFLVVLVVAMHALLRIYYIEMKKQGTIRNAVKNPFLRRHLLENRMLCDVNREMRVVLARLDVVLVGIRPMEHDLLARVGDGVGFRLVVGFACQVPERHEITLVVIALKEMVEVVVHVYLAIAVRRTGFERRFRRRILLSDW